MSLKNPRRPTTIMRCAADVAPESIDWLWPSRIARGKLTLLAGDPGLGKSFLTVEIASRVTRGAPWPDGAPGISEPGSVIFLNAEDDPADTIRPRLDAAGADVRRVHFIEGVRMEGDAELETTERAFCLSADRERLREAIEQCPGCKLVILDPISAFLGNVKSHENADVRGLLSPFTRLAAETGVALLAVTHLNKNGGGSALYRSTGSLAFVAAARGAMLVAKDPTDPSRRVMVSMKNNIALEPPGLAFQVNGESGLARIEWFEGAVTLSADEVLAAAGTENNPDDEKRSAVDEAAEFLKEILADGPCDVKNIEKEAKAAGISISSLRRARNKLGIRPRKVGFGGESRWTLPGWIPPDASTPVESDHPAAVAEDVRPFDGFDVRRQEPEGDQGGVITFENSPEKVEGDQGSQDPGGTESTPDDDPEWGWI